MRFLALILITSIVAQAAAAQDEGDVVELPDAIGVDEIETSDKSLSDLLKSFPKKELLEALTPIPQKIERKTFRWGNGRRIVYDSCYVSQNGHLKCQDKAGTANLLCRALGFSYALSIEYETRQVPLYNYKIVVDNGPDSLPFFVSHTGASLVYTLQCERLAS